MRLTNPKNAVVVGQAGGDRISAGGRENIVMIDVTLTHINKFE